MIRHATLMICLAMALEGCSSSSKPDGSELGARSRLSSTENGLELRRWTIMDKPQRIAQALIKYADAEAVSETLQARLKRNGFRFVRVSVDELDALLEDLGGATVDANQWHGQCPQWRSLQDRPVQSSRDSAGRAVAIDGRVRRFERGEFRLLIRSWTAQMEDGPRIHLEALPVYRSPQADDLRRLLGKESAQGEGFAAAALDLQLESGYAYVLVGESPQSDWPGVPGATWRDRAATHRSTSDKTRIGPSDSTGPEAAAPLTLGEVLLGGQPAPPTRDLLVFVPRIGPELFPAQPQAAAEPFTKGPDDS